MRTAYPLSPERIKRFWSNVDKSGECWVWTATLSKGYGRFRNDGRYDRASRIAWYLTYGRIPDNFIVCHHCDNPSCVNPNHLFLGTHKDNAQDKVRKGRAQWGEQATLGKLNREQVFEIRNLYLQGVSQRELARRHGVTSKAIKKILTGEHWKNLADEDQWPNIHRDYKPNRQFTDDQIRDIRSQFSQGVTKTELAKRFKYSWRGIDFILKGKLYPHVKDVPGNDRECNR